MNLPALILSTGLSFLLLVLIFGPLECVFPAKPGQRFFRPAWFTDLCFFLGQYLLWSGVVLAILTAFNGWLGSIVASDFREVVGAQPWWLQVMMLVLLSDILVY